MRYPRQQAEVVALVDQMIAGITEHSDIFVHCDAAVLQAARDEYEQANEVLIDAQAQVAIASVAKLERFNQLQQEMKRQIKLGVVDTSNNPVELSYIGWGTKRTPTPLEIPAQPTELKITAQGSGMLCLIWNKGKGGGPIRAYIIERRSNNQDWQLAATALNNEAKLLKQPLGCKLEYRVKAINSSGESMPSNTVGVVL